MPKLKKNTVLPSPAEDAEIIRQAAEDGTLLSDQQLSEMKPLGHFPKLASLVKRGRPVLDNPKRSVNIRLSPDVLESFKATGRGWQTRIDNALKDWLKEHRP